MRALLPPLLLGCAHPRPVGELSAGEPVVEPALTWRRGVHVTHWLGHLLPDYLGSSGIPHDYAAPWFDDEDLAWLAEHGFDHVQIHVDAEQWFSPSGALLEARLAPFDAIVEAAGRHRLGVVLLLQGTPGEPASAPVDLADPATVGRRTEGWRALAARFGRVGLGLRYRTDEDALPAGQASRQRLEGYLQAIWASSPERFVYLPLPLASEGDPADPLSHLGEPSPWDGRVGLSFSYYRPEIFVFQRPDQPVRIPFPGAVPDLGDLSAPGWPEWYLPLAREAVVGAPLGPEAIDAQFAALGAWATAQDPGRELYLGEFGLFEGTEPEAARQYLGALVRAAERHGVAWSVYDYESGRAVRGEDGQPTALYEGLGIGG